MNGQQSYSLIFRLLTTFVDVGHYQMCVHFTHMINVHFIWLPESSINHPIYLKEFCIYGRYVLDIYIHCVCVSYLVFLVPYLSNAFTHLRTKAHNNILD